MQRNDEDDAWQAIVDNYGERPTLEDEPAADGADDDTATGQVAGGHDAEALTDTDAPDVDAEADPFEEEFVPPRPAPAPRPPADRLAAWWGVLGAPAVLVVLAVAGIDLPDWVLLGLVAAIIGGFGYLVATMNREPRDPWDDGAQV
ncbi:hypothetical protein KUV85_03020 [Nocardioides panacisoli]|uniref:hypothetical protein n=1 Tax=Nocardioides panacisoli TaxID=627624 RepID=UPI001C631C4F|nr:hypothetical protein [Nocardioides panacisoli]QYJ04668.1 hypothetical protein KUV85_03020 [Nocardioides panacisoli]